VVLAGQILGLDVARERCPQPLKVKLNCCAVPLGNIRFLQAGLFESFMGMTQAHTRVPVMALTRICITAQTGPPAFVHVRDAGHENSRLLATPAHRHSI
jgi:hypothetical protein